MIKKINILLYLIATTWLMSACTNRIIPNTFASDECIPMSNIKINKQARSRIIEILQGKIVSPRRNLDLADFCAYRETTSNGTYSILNIFDRVGGMHVSPTWILTNSGQVIDTKLNSFTMGNDTVQARVLIFNSVSQLQNIDELSKNELVIQLMQDVRRYSKKKP